MKVGPRSRAEGAVEKETEEDSAWKLKKAEELFAERRRKVPGQRRWRSSLA